MSSLSTPEQAASEPVLVRRIVPVPRGPIDVPLLVIAGLLTLVGLFELTLASVLTGGGASGEFTKQLYFGVGGGGLLMLVAQRVDHRLYAKYGWLIGLVGVALLGVTLFLATGETKGAQRWIPLGPLRPQPSELLKFTNLVFVSAWIVHKDLRIAKVVDGLAGLGVYLVAVSTILYLQPDFGSMLLLGAATIALLTVGGAAPKHLAVAGAFFGVLALVGVRAVQYRSARFDAWLNPLGSELEEAGQLRSAIIALARGGELGTGIRDGRSHFGFVYESENDFIATSIGEHFGLLGFVGLVCAYLLLFQRCLRIAERAPSRFGMLLAIGIGISFISQAYFHLGVNNGAFPTKGLTLPFVSAGVSSLWMSFAMIGVLQNIAQSNIDVRQQNANAERAVLAQAEQMRSRERFFANRLHSARRRHGR